jgi:hypothetical protein
MGGQKAGAAARQAMMWVLVVLTALIVAVLAVALVGRFMSIDHSTTIERKVG